MGYTYGHMTPEQGFSPESPSTYQQLIHVWQEATAPLSSLEKHGASGLVDYFNLFSLSASFGSYASYMKQKESYSEKEFDKDLPGKIPGWIFAHTAQEYLETNSDIPHTPQVLEALSHFRDMYLAIESAEDFKKFDETAQTILENLYSQ